MTATALQPGQPFPAQASPHRIGIGMSSAGSANRSRRASAASWLTSYVALRQDPCFPLGTFTGPMSFNSWHLMFMEQVQRDSGRRSIEKSAKAHPGPWVLFLPRSAWPHFARPSPRSVGRTRKGASETHWRWWRERLVLAAHEAVGSVRPQRLPPGGRPPGDEPTAEPCFHQRPAKIPRKNRAGMLRQPARRHWEFPPGPGFGSLRPLAGGGSKPHGLTPQGARVLNFRLLGAGGKQGKGIKGSP